MDILAFGDPHIKPANPAIDLDALRVPPDIDIVVTIGDIIQRPGDLETGRAFFERLNASETPVVCVPGNHDPAEHYPEMIGGLEHVVLVHDCVVTDGELGVIRNGHGDELTVAGLGCETTKHAAALGAQDVDALDPRKENDRRHAADVAAQTLEDAVFDYLAGNMAPDDLVSSLDVRRSERGTFLDALAEVERRFDRVDALFEGPEDPDVFLSHVPPYNTALDRHHSIGERDRDLEELHVGSLGLKVALRKHAPPVALSGHSHNREYEVGSVDNPKMPHFLSLDFRGVARLTVESTFGTFAYEFL